MASGKNDNQAKRILSRGELLQLARWNTPTIYNGLEAITSNDRLALIFNREETRDFMGEMGAMVGYAMTVVIEPGNHRHKEESPGAWRSYREYVGQGDYPKIIVVQDLDGDCSVGSFWGEVNASIHKALGCVGTITDGAIRDVDEMSIIGFKAIAKRLCVGHAYSHPVRWNCSVHVFGVEITPGDLIHADKHGFLVVPPRDASNLLDAARFMDANECETLIAATKAAAGKSLDEFLNDLDAASTKFKQNRDSHFSGIP
ncbi:RraA family protein [Candidatus Bathyarchaeota archaeon]|nr:RraA family protein [Candidatus Bathyarchaeota archaeon]